MPQPASHEPTPAQRARTHGIASLSDPELLTLALLGDTEQDGWRRHHDAFASLLARHGGLGALTNATVLQPEDGLSALSSVRLQAIQQLHLRLSVEEDNPKGEPISGVSQAAALFIPLLACLSEETLMVMPATAGLHPTPVRSVAVGHANTVSATPAQVLRPAVEQNAPNLFIAHNHPDGDPQPSPRDWKFTKRMIRAAALLNVTLQDHIIVAGNRYRSMRQENPATFGAQPESRCNSEEQAQ